MQIYLLAFSELMPTSQAANIPKVDENGINEVLDINTISVFCFFFLLLCFGVEINMDARPYTGESILVCGGFKDAKMRY